MTTDIAEFDTIEECVAAIEDPIERDIAVHELLVDGYWDSLRAKGGESRELFD